MQEENIKHAISELCPATIAISCRYFRFSRFFLRRRNSRVMLSRYAGRLSFRTDSSCSRVLINEWWRLSTPSRALISAVTKVIMNDIPHKNVLRLARLTNEVISAPPMIIKWREYFQGASRDSSYTFCILELHNMCTYVSPNRDKYNSLARKIRTLMFL